MATNRIGLDSDKAQNLAQKLNILLSNYQIFYMNVRGYHWNIRGAEFFELHVKFEEEYTLLLAKVDEIAERILTLGFQPIHAYSSYLANADIEEHVGVRSSKNCLEGLLDGYGKLIRLQRELKQLAEEADDEGTATLMSDYISEQEKTVWMYSARLDA